MNNMDKFEEECNKLITDITGLSDPELAHEAIKVLLATMSTDKRF